MIRETRLAIGFNRIDPLECLPAQESHRSGNPGTAVAQPAFANATSQPVVTGAQALTCKADWDCSGPKRATIGQGTSPKVARLQLTYPPTSYLLPTSYYLDTPSFSPLFLNSQTPEPCRGRRVVSTPTTQSPSELSPPTTSSADSSSRSP